MRKALSILLPVVASGLMAMPAMAKSPFISGSNISVNSESNLRNLTLTVSGPNGFHAQAFEKGFTPSVSLIKDGKMADGLYTWQLSGSTDERVYGGYKTSINSGRGEKARDYTFKGSTESGSFRVENGVAVAFDETEEE